VPPEPGDPKIAETVRAEIAALDVRAHWPKERERLELLLRELQAFVNEQPVAWAPLGSLTEGWRTGDPRTRRELICEFFDELNVEDGRIATAVPRRDRAAQVANLIEHAFDEQRGGSPGGIRGQRPVNLAAGPNPAVFVAGGWPHGSAPLHISAKTVETHLAQVFAKLSVANRSAVGAAIGAEHAAQDSS
jgi:hypothetical protein